MVIAAALIEPRRRQRARCQPIAREENDTKRLLHHPRAKKHDAERNEQQQAKQGEQLVAEFHAAGCLALMSGAALESSFCGSGSLKSACV